jgi:hypothetical protein
MDRIRATRRLREPPEWARLERELIEFLDGVADPVVDGYVDGDGSLRWPPADDYVGIDGHDDAYESFWNWPLYYVVGGDERYLDLARAEYEAIVAQFSEVETPFGHPMAVEEYEQCRDWFHQGEGNLLFYFLCLADPDHEPTVERAERFAGFYLPGSDTGNYDPEERIVTAPMTGSMGPDYCDLSAFTHHSYGADYVWGKWGLPFQDVPGIDSIDDVTDPGNEERLYDLLADRCSRGDVVSNLAVTGLVANAYLLTGDERYREWVREYVGAWENRAAANDGPIPDNVGRSGEVGEYLDGKWYGGFYGWTWVGWHAVGAAVTVAAETATLLEGDPGHLDLLRSQVDALLENAIERPTPGESASTLYVPHKYGDPGDYHFDPGDEEVLREDDGAVRWEDGWFLFHPVTDAGYLAHLWHASMADGDRERLRRTRDHRTRDWENPRPTLNGKYVGGHERAWEAYLAGEFPDYPAEILRLDRYQARRRVRRMEDDRQDPATYDDHYLQQRNPVVEEGLLQLTMGAPQPVYNGGLLMARVRHFDPERERPGLPPDVAALVERIEADRTVLRLVNVGANRREVTVQAGAYGEHEFGSVLDRAARDGSRRSLSPGDPYLRVSLPPETEARLDLGTDRFANDPRYAVPWSDARSG